MSTDSALLLLMTLMAVSFSRMLPSLCDSTAMILS
jgi:hypothetical protein